MISEYERVEVNDIINNHFSFICAPADFPLLPPLHLPLFFVLLLLIFLFLSHSFFICIHFVFLSSTVVPFFAFLILIRAPFLVSFFFLFLLVLRLFLSFSSYHSLSIFSAAPDCVAAYPPSFPFLLHVFSILASVPFFGPVVSSVPFSPVASLSTFHFLFL